MGGKSWRDLVCWALGHRWLSARSTIGKYTLRYTYCDRCGEQGSQAARAWQVIEEGCSVKWDSVAKTMTLWVDGRRVNLSAEYDGEFDYWHVSMSTCMYGCGSPEEGLSLLVEMFPVLQQGTEQSSESSGTDEPSVEPNETE